MSKTTLNASHNVLLIEDDAAAADMARRAASGISIELSVLESVDAVLAWLDGNGVKKKTAPHIILLDLKLPKLDGLAVLRKLRMHAATRDVPVIVFSAEYIQSDVQLAYQVGANSFVAKPAEQQQFTDFFRDQLTYWLQPRQRELAFAQHH
ncbi:MAG TPA: response regulator [Gallionella sp.]|nr:response regulator [Gallionella sp.]